MSNRSPCVAAPALGEPLHFMCMAVFFLPVRSLFKCHLLREAIPDGSTIASFQPLPHILYCIFFIVFVILLY